jgi:hypothetical protein
VAKSVSAGAEDRGATRPLLLATQTEALRELGTLWGQQLPTDEPCQGAPKLNLRCYQGRGGLYELRLLDRPAIVALHDGQKLGYAVLSSMDADSATLSVNGQRQKVSLGALATRFDGEFTTLWKQPRAFRDEIHPGDTGAGRGLDRRPPGRLNKVEAPRADRPLDEATRRLLRGFQAGQNLKADGVAGPRTYMRLNQLSGVDEPRPAGARRPQGRENNMSYILEALKKAQAERQLGNAPTIHAPQRCRPPSRASPPAASRCSSAWARARWWWRWGRCSCGSGAGAGAGCFDVRAAPASTAAPCAPAAASLIRPSWRRRAPARWHAPIGLEHAGSERTACASRPAPSPPRPAHGGAAAAPAVPPAPPMAQPRPRRFQAAASRAPPPRRPSPEDSLPYLHQLPDTMQREVPRVSFGGYMYSANPADRLLLVDKTLRHEGEEVAPGLVLEKLLPKAAVMNYRGVRYRVAY